MQTHVETVAQAIKSTKVTISEGPAPPSAHDYLDVLGAMQGRLLESVEHLFASLNIGANFPDLSAFPLQFVQILLLARDIKRNIRLRAIGAFFEWDRLDQAVGGRDEALGQCIFITMLTMYLIYYI